MTSSININNPTNRNPTIKSIRDNFVAAATDIEELQTQVSKKPDAEFDEYGELSAFLNEDRSKFVLSRIKTFSDLPNASLNPFGRYFISDLGMAEFYSNGISWVPASPTTLSSSGSVSGFTTGTNESVLFSYEFRPNQLHEDARVLMSGVVSTQNNSNVKTLRLRLGGTGVNGSVLWTNAITSTLKQSFVAGFFNRGAKNSQVQATVDDTSGFGSSTTSLLIASVDTSLAQKVYLTAECAVGTDTVTLQNYVLEQR